jgi:hypothetical protein
MEVFIHEEYVHKRREQRQQQRHRRQMKIETEKQKPQQSTATGQGSPREQPAGVWSSPAGSPTAEASSSFRDHFFDYLKPY